MDDSLLNMCNLKVALQIPVRYYCYKTNVNIIRRSEHSNMISGELTHNIALLNSAHCSDIITKYQILV